MGLAVADAAAEAGIGLTLLDVAYLAGGFGEPVTEAQQRFSDGKRGAWASRVAELPDSLRVGVGMHSVRAVPFAELPPVVQAAGGRPRCCTRTCPSSRPRTRDASRRPGDPDRPPRGAGALGPRTALVHGTHLTDVDIAISAGARARW